MIHGKSWHRYSWPAACEFDYPICYEIARQFYPMSIALQLQFVVIIYVNVSGNIIIYTYKSINYETYQNIYTYI